MPHRRSAATIAVAVALASGVALRFRGLFSDFWLDEIWGLRIALDAPSFLALITRIHADTNHPLVSLWMHALGPQRHWEWYRALSLACGIGTVALLGRFGRMALVMGALSFPLIVYSSEARGYAPAAFFLLLAYVVWRRNDALYGISIVLAILAHLSAVAVYAGFLAADAPKRDWKRHVMPVAFGAWYYVIKVRHLVAGGGPRWSLTDAALGAASMAGGGPEGPGLIAALAGIAVFAVLAFELARSKERLFFAVALFVGPLIAALRYTCPCVLPRHFFVCMPFALILLASFAERFRWSVAVFIAANAIQLAPFVAYGRGQYLRALTDIARASGGTAVAGGDNDFRNGLLAGFYRPYLPDGLSVRYVPRAAHPEWLLMEQPATGLPLFRRYRYGGISGWDWYVYRLPVSKPASIQR